RLPRLGVEKRIENFSVFDHILPQSSFQNESGFFQNASGRRIVRMRHGENAIEREFFEAIFDKRWDYFAHDALPPEFFTEPVTKFRGVPVYIFAGPQPDPTDR